MFGKAVKFFRERAGLSQTELGALSNYSNTVINKIEKGERPPAEGFPERMDAIPQLETNGELSRLWGWLAESARHGAYPGWFDRWPDLEGKAKRLRTFELVAVPGLLQTTDYARAMLRTQVMATDDEIEEMVEARIARQQILHRDKPPMLWVLIDEVVLRRPVGGVHVMREQLGKLIEAAARPNVVVQVIPLSIGAHQGLSGNFVVADFDDGPSVAYQDTAVQGVIIDDAEQIEALMELWDTIKSAALPWAASLELIEEVAKTCT
ncbi:MAG TPA: helix-turn-helix transcriptional regulator [Streptosporangiaceae bacterium]